MKPIQPQISLFNLVALNNLKLYLGNYIKKLPHKGKIILKRTYLIIT